MRRLIWVLLLVPQVVFAQATLSPEVRQHLQAGLQAEQQRSFDAALAEFEKVVEIDPMLPVGHVKVGQAHIEQGEFAKAIDPLKKALELDGELVPAHRLLGYALLAQGFAADSISHLERAQDDGALGIALIETDRPSEAVSHLQSALAKSPNDPDLLFYLTRASGMLSTETMNKVLSSYAGSPRAHQIAGQNYFMLRQYPQAEKEYQAAIAMRPDLADLHLELGQVYAESAQWPKAAEEYRTACVRQPGNPEAAFRFGNALLQQGSAALALKELKRANEMRPDMTETLYALGKAASQAGQDKVAEEAWLRVAQLEEHGDLTSQAHFSLAGLYRKQKKLELAAKEMKAYQALRSEQESLKSQMP